jgi:hypothetical protein
MRTEGNGEEAVMEGVLPAFVVGTIVGVAIGWIARQYYMGAELAGIAEATKRMKEGTDVINQSVVINAADEGAVVVEGK